MNLLFFISFARCLSDIGTMMEENETVEHRSFGFSKKGILTVNFSGKNLENTVFLILTEKERKIIKDLIMINEFNNTMFIENGSINAENLKKFCFNSFIINSSVSSYAITWKSHEKLVVYPMTLNFGKKTVHFNITCMNNASFLDTRDAPVFIIIAALVATYSFITIRWFHSLVKYSKFCSLLSIAFITANILKIGSLIANLVYWKTMSDENHVCEAYVVFNETMYVVVNSIIIGITSLAIYGWGIIRTSVEPEDIVSAFISGLWVFTVRSVMNFIDNTISLFVMFSLCYLAIFLKFMHSRKWASIYKELYENNMECEQLKNKALLGFQYCKTIEIVMKVFMVITIIMGIRVRYALLLACEEMMILLIVAVNFSYFLVTDEHMIEEEKEENNDNVVKHYDNIMFVDDPKENYLAIISNSISV